VAWVRELCVVSDMSECRVFDAKLEQLLQLNGFEEEVYRNAGMGFLWSEDIDCYTRKSFEECGFTPEVCDRLVQLKESVEEYLRAHPAERRPPARLGGLEGWEGGEGGEGGEMAEKKALAACGVGVREVRNVRVFGDNRRARAGAGGEAGAGGVRGGAGGGGVRAGRAGGGVGGGGDGGKAGECGSESIQRASIKERGGSGMDRESVGAMLARLGHLAGVAEEGGGHPAEVWKARKQNGGGVSYYDLDAYLPSRFEDAKMAEVTYIDPNEYVIVHWSTWTDPTSGASHRVEYRDTRYAHHDEDAYDVATLEKWQDGVLVETLSRGQLLTRIKKWTYAPEPEIGYEVWRQLGVLCTHDVEMQWKVNEEDGVHLMEIVRYHQNSTHDLWRDGKRLYEGQLQMLEEEQTKMNTWPRARAPEEGGGFKSHLEKIRAETSTPPAHVSESAEADRLVRAFVAPVEALWTYVEGSGPQPMGWRDATEVVARVREARALVVEVKGLLDFGLRPTTKEVRAILQKLQEVAAAKARVRNHRNESDLTMKLMACGPPCQKYVEYIDPEQSQSLPWQNGMTRMQTPAERAGL
jgi:hypothetical protein